jgi:hypothetical protein
MATDRSSIDIAPTRSRPGLAFLLALLSVPGSTIAWDLPAGGFWIGLPLAIAAIVIGAQALRSSGRSGMAIAAIVIAALMIVQMAIWTIVSLAT